MAGARDVSFIFRGKLRVTMIQVYSFEVVFVLEVEMVVNDNTLAIAFAKQGKKTFGIYRFRVRLAQMEYVKPFVEECCKDLMLFHEKIRSGHKD